MTISIDIYDFGAMLVCCAVAVLAVAGAARVACLCHNRKTRRRLNRTNQQCWDMGPVHHRLPIVFSCGSCLDNIKATCGVCQADIHDDDLRGDAAKLWSVKGLARPVSPTALIEAVSLCRGCRSVARQSLVVNDRLKLDRHASRWLDSVQYVPSDRTPTPVDAAGRADFEEV